MDKIDDLELLKLPEDCTKEELIKQVNELTHHIQMLECLLLSIQSNCINLISIENVMSYYNDTDKVWEIIKEWGNKPKKQVNPFKVWEEQVKEKCVKQGRTW